LYLYLFNLIATMHCVSLLVIGNVLLVIFSIQTGDCGVKLTLADVGLCPCVPDNGRRNQSSDND